MARKPRQPSRNEMPTRPHVSRLHAARQRSRRNQGNSIFFHSPSSAAHSFRMLYHDFVFLKVGPKAKRFGVHKAPLVRESEYFRAAFNGSFSEATTGKIHLTEDIPGVVGAFVTWLYTRELARPGPDGVSEVDLSDEDLIDLYTFADAKLVRRLQWDVMDELVERVKETEPTVYYVILAYNTFPENSPVRAFFVDWFCWRHTDPEDVTATLRSWEERGCSSQFFIDVGSVCGRHPKRGSGYVKEPWVRHKCLYHKHRNGETCKKKKR